MTVQQYSAAFELSYRSGGADGPIWLHVAAHIRAFTSAAWSVHCLNMVIQLCCLQCSLECALFILGHTALSLGVLIVVYL